MTWVPRGAYAEAFKSAARVSCWLSIFGSLCMIASFLFFKDLRGNSRALLVWLSVADLLTAIVLLLPLTGDHILSTETDFCNVTAVLGIFCPVASFLWTDCVAWYLYQVFNRSLETAEQNSRIFAIFHVICWSIPTILSIVVTVADVEGYNSNNDGEWCWVRQVPTPVVWELVAGKAIEWFSTIVFVPLFYFLTLRSLRRMSFREPKVQKFARRMGFVPLIFFVVRIWGSILTVWPLFGDLPPYWLLLVAGVFEPLQGFFNSLVFLFLNGDVRIVLSNIWSKWKDPNYQQPLMAPTSSTSLYEESTSDEYFET